MGLGGGLGNLHNLPDWCGSMGGWGKARRAGRKMIQGIGVEGGLGVYGLIVLMVTEIPLLICLLPSEARNAAPGTGNQHQGAWAPSGTGF